MNHKAIYALYPNVVIVHGNEGAFDAEGNQVVIDEVLVNAWVDPEEYKYKRAAEYPSIVDQLDTIYHDGIDAWKEQINTIKEKYPKG
jgi:hypothetical protein